MISNTPTITINELTLFDYTYRWHVPPDAQGCNVVMRGAGGGGAGGESLMPDRRYARSPLAGQRGGHASQCIFSLALNADELGIIDLVVGKGGEGGKPNALGSPGSVSEFGSWVTINGGLPGTYSTDSPLAQVMWSTSPLLRVSSICEVSPLDSKRPTEVSTQETSMLGTSASATRTGGTGGNGANGFIQILWY